MAKDERLVNTQKKNSSPHKFESVAHEEQSIVELNAFSPEQKTPQPEPQPEHPEQIEE